MPRGRKDRNMEDKNLYNKVMLIAFCIIIVLLGAGMYSRSMASKRAMENYTPRGTVHEVQNGVGQEVWT